MEAQRRRPKYLSFRCKLSAYEQIQLKIIQPPMNGLSVERIERFQCCLKAHDSLHKNTFASIKDIENQLQEDKQKGLSCLNHSMQLKITYWYS